MAVYSVFSTNISTTYKTTLCSKTTIFFVVVTFLTFFLPLLIAYRSQGFWVKHLSYREQPQVRFKRQYYLHFETEDEMNPIICISHSNENEALEQLNKCVLIKFNEVDENGDGKFDYLRFQTTVNAKYSSPILSVFILLVFDYHLQIQCLLAMESIASLQTSSSIPGQKLTVYGDLKFVQKSLLRCRGYDVRYNTSIFEEDGFIIDEIVKSHALRNVSTRLENVYSIWTRGRSGDAFELDIQINYPETLIYYRPGFWPVIKWAWIQYLAVLVIFLGIARWVKAYVFLNHLLPTVSFAPWRKSI